MEWQSIDETLKIIILLGAATGAATGIYMFLRRVHRWMQLRYASLEWMFSEEHDHAMIKESLDEICKILKVNSDRQDYFRSYIQALLQANKTAIFEADPAGHVTWVNKAYTRMMGVSSGEVLGMNFRNIIDPMHREAVMDNWLDRVETKSDYDEFVPILNGRGERFMVHALAYMIRDNDGKSLGYLGEVQPAPDGAPNIK